MATTAQKLQAFLGAWDAQPAGPGSASAMACRRTFTASPGAGFVIMTANWRTGGGPYEEVAVFSLDPSDRLKVVSLTLDGGRSEGAEALADGLPEGAIALVARMPAGLARSIYWPVNNDFHLAVESEDAGGWKRFMEHRYVRTAEG